MAFKKHISWCTYWGRSTRSDVDGLHIVGRHAGRTDK